MQLVFRAPAAVVLLLGLLTIFESKAHATSVQQYDLATMFRESALVVRARVVEGSGYARELGGDIVCTDVNLQVLDVLAGQWDTSEPLGFCLPGGITASGRMQMVLGAPMPSVGDTYVLFIRGGEWAYTPFVDWFYGALREERFGGGTGLVTSNGDCVVSANNAFLEVGVRVTVEDQMRHLSSLGVDLDSVMSVPTSGTLSSPSGTGAGPGQTGSEPSNQCASASSIVSALRQRANARASTSSLAGSSNSARPAIQAYHTPFHVEGKRGAQ